MTTAFTTVVILALLPQIAFFVLYWRWIPAWRFNKYGRLAQAGAMCHIILLTLYLCLVWWGKYWNHTVTEVVLVAAFVPLIFFGIFQLSLLRLAVDSSRPVKEVVMVDTGQSVEEDKENLSK